MASTTWSQEIRRVAGELADAQAQAARARLRDEFAMAALSSLAPTLAPLLTDEQLARRIYKLADAMLEARNANR